MSLHRDATRAPKVYITAAAHRQLMAYIGAVYTEISGLGIVEMPRPGMLVITDIMLLEQESTSGDTNLDQDAMGRLMFQMIEAGQDTGTLKFWWHSHANMDVFWSATDESAIANLVEGSEWILSIVGNRQGEILARIDTFSPLPMTVDHVPVTILYPADTAYYDAIMDEVKDKVRLMKSVKDPTNPQQYIQVPMEGGEGLDESRTSGRNRTNSRGRSFARNGSAPTSPSR